MHPRISWVQITGGDHDLAGAVDHKHALAVQVLVLVDELTQRFLRGVGRGARQVGDAIHGHATLQLDLPGPVAGDAQQDGHDQDHEHHDDE